MQDLDHFEFIRCIAVARIMMPKSHVRLSAGREAMNEQMQAMCFMAGANSIFYGCKLLTAANPETNQDMLLFKKLGINTETVSNHDVDEGDEARRLHTAVVNQENSELFYNAE